MARTTIFEEQTLTFEVFDNTTETIIYGVDLPGIEFNLEAGKQYIVNFDGVEYPVTAYGISEDIFSFPAVGNAGLMGAEPITDDPFIVWVIPKEIGEEIGEGTGWTSIATLLEGETHTVAVYSTSEQPEQPEEPHGIILRNYHGENVVYEDVETITFGNTAGGIDTFTRGIAVHDVPISLDFSNGDQTITAEDGYLVKSAVIEKPENLIPENIRINQNVAGITGAFIGEDEETEVDLNMVDGDMVITPSENKLFSSVTVKKPETLKQENIAAGVEIAGIVGTHQGSGGGISDENLKYFKVSFDDYGITVYNVFYNKIQAETGSYDVEVPDTLSGLPVYIKSNDGSYGVFYGDGVKNVIIGENVKWVNNSMNNAFYYCKIFNSPVKVPVGITHMINTFFMCSNLNQPIAIPNGVVDTRGAFEYCSNLNQPITIPNTVTNATNMFRDCRNLNQPITIPGSVKNAQNMFRSCENLNQPIIIQDGVTNTHEMFGTCLRFNQPIIIPNTVTNASSMFYQTGNFDQSVIIPGSVKDASSMFNRAGNLRTSSIIIENGVSNISGMFNECKNFNSKITLYDSVTNMMGTFHNCLLYNQPITIPKNVTEVRNAFRNCKNMAQNITVYAKNINNVCGFVNGKTNSLRINIFIPPDCNTNNVFFGTESTNSIVNRSITWTNNKSNQCRYNSSMGIYVYYNVVDEEETGA